MSVPLTTTGQNLELTHRHRAVRGSIRQLRQQIEATTFAYRTAKERRRNPQVTLLLRQRTELIQHLFQTQRELLELLRLESAEFSPVQASGAHRVAGRLGTSRGGAEIGLLPAASEVTSFSAFADAALASSRAPGLITA